MNNLIARINLSKIEYKILECAKIIEKPDYEKLKKIYYQYCEYKKFKIPLPFFLENYFFSSRDIIGYYDDDELIAYTLILKYPSENSVVSEQFAWNYENPKLQLGIKSLEHECGLYKSLGYDYLYVGSHQEYKSKFQGYELL